MCIPYRLVSLGLGVALTGCGGSLTLPDDGSPAALRVLSGDRQEARVGRRLENPLVVKLTNASSDPIEGISVVFQFKGDVPDAEVDPTATTDSAGRASAEVRLGTSVGPHEVEARVASSAALTATFVVTALERDQGKKDKGGDGDDDDD